MTRTLIVCVVVFGVSCKKKERAAAPPTPVVAADAAVAKPPVPKPDASVADAAVAAHDGGAAALDPEEQLEGCPKQLTPAMEKESADYKPVCEKALTKVMGCRKDAKLTSQLKNSDMGWGKDTAATLKRLAGTAKDVTETCDSLAHDLHCGYQGRMFSQVPEAADLQKVADAADCAAAGAALADVSFMPTGE